jgi:lipoate---protein ligase
LCCSSRGYYLFAGNRIREQHLEIEENNTEEMKETINEEKRERQKIVYKSASTDPFLNLAFERSLLANPAENSVLFLYTNSPAVIIGRYQHAFRECRADVMQKHHIKLVRRYSGGGAVYHDSGNLNFCFIGPRNGFDKKLNSSFIADVLGNAGLQVTSGDRGDLFCNGRKFSGNAFKYSGRKVLHHGTLLVKADLDMLNKTLAAIPLGRARQNEFAPTIIDTKAVCSQPSPVCNLAEFINGITPDMLTGMLSEAFSSRPAVKIDSAILAQQEVRRYYNELKSREWLWDAAPLCTIKESQSGFGLKFEKGLIYIAENPKPYVCSRAGFEELEAYIAAGQKNTTDLLKLIANLKMFFI